MSGDNLVLFGGNNGSGEPGVTDLIIPAAASGIVQFQFSYSSFDVPYADYGTYAVGDRAGYLLGDVFHQLATIDGQSSGGVPVTFSVNAGEVFGFRVDTADNLVEPGILTISDFSAPISSSVPEPATVLLIVAGGALLAGRSQLSRMTKGDA